MAVVSGGSRESSSRQGLLVLMVPGDKGQKSFSMENVNPHLPVSPTHTYSTFESPNNELPKHNLGNIKTMLQRTKTQPSNRTI